MLLYRAVSQPELEDIFSSGQFRSDPEGFIFGKWFALQPEDAAAWGRWFRRQYGKIYSVVTTVAPASLAATLSILPNLDNIGPAVIVEDDQLSLLSVSALQPVLVDP